MKQMARRKIMAACILGCMAVAACVFWIAASHEDSDDLTLRRAMTLADSDETPDIVRAITACDSLLAMSEKLSESQQAKAAAIRAYARYRSGIDDTADRYLTDEMMAALRRLGGDEVPFLLRGLYARSRLALEAGRDRDALNDASEAADRSLRQFPDTFIAARAYATISVVYYNNYQYQSASEANIRAAQLFNSVDDDYGSDFQWRTAATNISQYSDSSLLRRSYGILDSLRHRDGRSRQWLDSIRLYQGLAMVALRQGKFDRAKYADAIAFVDTALANCDNIDSLWTYSIKALAQTRLGDFGHAAATYRRIDSIRNHVSFDRGDKYWTVAEDRLALMDSMGVEMVPIDFVRQCVHETDTTNRLYVRNLRNLFPDYEGYKPVMEKVMESEYTLLAAIGLLVVAVIAIFRYRRNARRLTDNESNLQERIEKLSAKGETLQQKLDRTMAEAEDLTMRLADLAASRRKEETHAQAANNENTGSTMPDDVSLMPTPKHGPLPRKFTMEYLFGSLMLPFVRAEADIRMQQLLYKVEAEKICTVLKSAKFTEAAFDTIVAQYPGMGEAFPHPQYHDPRLRMAVYLFYGLDMKLIAWLGGMTPSTAYARREKLRELLTAHKNADIQLFIDQYLQ